MGKGIESSLVPFEIYSESTTSSLFCGEFEGSIQLNNTNNDVVYTFNGVEKKNPESFKRKQTCLSASLEDVVDNDLSLLSLLDIEMECTIKSFSNPIVYTVDSLSVLFSNSSFVSFFNCSETIPVNTFIPIKLLSCENPVLQDLTLLLQSSQSLSFSSYTSRLEITDLLGDVDLMLKNRDVCKTDVVSVVGSFFAFVLVGAFLFLIVFAYNTKKNSRYIGNGIDVNNIQYISKPFSCAVNPYSKKSKVIPVTPQKQETVSSIEINTITLQPHGTHSSFFMM